MKKIILLTLIIAIIFIPSSGGAINLSKQLSGRILLQVEENGEAWYVEPVSLQRYFLPNPWLVINAVIKTEPLGITNNDLNLIPAAVASDYQVQNPKYYKDSLGWWGQIINDSVPVMDKTSTSSKQLGLFNTKNKVKILLEINGEEIDGNNTWYKIDGGQFPNKFIHSSFVSPLAQPEPPEKFTIPDEVEENEYWIDVDLNKFILTLIKYDTPEFVTYISHGTIYYPTRVGTYKINHKYEKILMSGGPPRFDSSYYLPNVPYTMYYSGDFAIHGTYWHDEFGTRKSHGCTNLTQGDAKYVFEHVRTDTVVFNHQ